MNRNQPLTEATGQAILAALENLQDLIRLADGIAELQAKAEQAREQKAQVRGEARRFVQANGGFLEEYANQVEQGAMPPRRTRGKKQMSKNPGRRAKP